MKKALYTTLFILLINQNLPSQTSSAASKLMDFFKSRKLYNSFIRHAETVNNNFFFAYGDKAFINNPYTHQNLFFAHLNEKGETIKGKVTKLMGFEGFQRVEMESASAGYIVAVAGFADLGRMGS